MNLSALLLLRNILSFITTTEFNTDNGNGNTSSPDSPSPPSTTTSLTPTLLPREPQGFTDPNLISQPITFYETVTALLLSAGRTYTSVYVNFVSATAAFPVNPSPTTTSPTSTTSTENSETASEAEVTIELTSTITSDIILTPTISKTPTTSSDTSPVLNLAPCSTFTAGVDDPALEGCISSVISALSLTGGGPIIASSTTTTTTTTTTTSMISTTTTAAAVITTVTPTRTVTLPYLGAVVAKGEATFVVGVESKGVRVRGRGVLVVVAVVVEVGLGIALVVLVGMG